MTGGDAYLEATTADAPSVAAAEVMDRLAERLKSASGTAESLTQMQAAAEAIAELARDADRPEAVINSARNAAGDVAQQASRKKATIIERIEAETDEVLVEDVAEDLRLERMYGLDRYLEMDLEEVSILRSTDHTDDTTLRWKFTDGAVVEHEDSAHMHRFEFWKKLNKETDKRLAPDLASEQIGEPDENEERYRRLSLGPEGRPWHPSSSLWIECITDLMDERGTETTRVGPRTAVWEQVQEWIRRMRMVADLDDAVAESQGHAVLDEDGDLLELWVPASEIARLCEEWGLEPEALQSELTDRGVDSDEVPGDGISEAFQANEHATRYWRFDATHDEVPPPDEIVEELGDDLSRDRPGHGFSYGGGE
jgi:hypothetical protein